MKLLIDAHCYDYKTSEGINTYLKGLYTALIPFATDIDFYFAGQDIQKLKGLFGEKKHVHYIPLQARNKVERLLTEIPGVVKKYGIDAAHFQYTSPLIKNCRTIVTLHDILFKDYPALFPWKYRISKDLLFKLSARRADLLLTVSAYSRERIAFHYDIPADQIVVTPNAVAEDFFHIDAQAASDFVRNKGIDRYILYVSRIEPRKNQLALLKAYIELELAQKGYDLVFIGRRTLPTPALDNCLENLPAQVRQHIHIYNQVSYEELKLWYKAAALFVYPALAEGFGIPPIEAGAAGVPCICSNKTAMGDFTFFGKNLIDVNDKELLKRTIKVNLTSPAVDLEQVSHSIRNQYNWDIIAQHFYSHLQKI